MKRLLLLLILFLVSPAAFSQTGGVAFRIRGGTAAPPATCRSAAPVDVYYRTTTDVFYVCTAPNIWTIGFTAGGAAGGDVVGPASSTDNAVVRFDSTTGKLIQNSAVTIADTSGDITTPGIYKAGDGGVSSASYQFGTEATLGFFRRGAGQLGVTSGSSTIGWFDGTGWHGFGTAVETFNDSASSTDGVILTTNGNATVGVQKLSPRLRLSGSGWKTNATAAARMTDWIIENQPVQGAADPSTNLVFSSQVNSGGYTSRVTFKSGGDVAIPGTLSPTTINAFTLGGTIAGGGNQLNNIIIGTSTPLAGTFTTLAAAGVTTLGAGSGAPLIVNGGSSQNVVVFQQGGTDIGALSTNSGLVIVNGRSGFFYDGGSLASPGNLKARITGSSNPFVQVASDGILGFNSATNISGNPDTGISRDSAGVIDFGTGAQGSTAGSWKATAGALSGTLTATGAAGGSRIGIQLNNSGGSVGDNMKINFSPAGLNSAYIEGAAPGGGLADLVFAPVAATVAVEKVRISSAGTTIANPIINSGITTDATHTDSAVCQDSTTHQFYFGSGTLGVCLGTSSARFKNHIEGFNKGLSRVLALQPKQFFYNKGYGDNGARKQFGFLAEDVVKFMPELVGLDAKNAPNSVDILGMIPRAIIPGMQELNAKFEAFQASTNVRMLALEKENKRLRALLRHRRH